MLQKWDKKFCQDGNISQIFCQVIAWVVVSMTGQYMHTNNTLWMIQVTSLTFAYVLFNFDNGFQCRVAYRNLCRNIVRTLFTYTSSSLPSSSPAGLWHVYGSWVKVGVEVGHGEVLKSWAKILLLYSHWGIWNFKSFLKQIFLTSLAWLNVQAARSCSCCILRTTYITHPKGDNEGCGRRLV